MFYLLYGFDVFFKFLKDFEIDFKIKQALTTFIN